MREPEDQAMNGYTEKTALVLYGTETGTAQDLAEEVGRCLQRLHFSVDVTDFNSVPRSYLTQYTLSVCIISTTGQGDFPSSARKFWTGLLRKKLQPTTLSVMRYVLFGLGDTSYAKFNWAARKLGKRLGQLGAVELMKPCEADEQGDEGTDGAFLEWLKEFRKMVLDRFPLSQDQEPIPEGELLPSKWRLETISESAKDMNGSASLVEGPNQSQAVDEDFEVILEANDRVTPQTHWQDVRFMRFRASTVRDYLPGDALAINPENMAHDVDDLVERLGWIEVADIPISLVMGHPPSRAARINPPPFRVTSNTEPMTLRYLLRKKLDINAIPRRSFFAAIANYTTDDTHRERLLEFTDPQYLDEYYDYATRPRRSILEILQEFHSVQLPWQEAINIFPAMRPRQFSIASGGALRGDNSTIDTVFELLVAIVEYRTVIKRVRQGVCTRYLAQLPVGATINVILKTEGRLATRRELVQESHLLIGAGTGIAPLRALIHEKGAQLSAFPSSIMTPHLPSTVLVFGARNAEADYFFANEWAQFSQSSSSSLALQVSTAFSRDQREKIYVQDRIRSQGEELATLLLLNSDHKPTIVVCGASGQMPKAVRQALVEILSSSRKEGSLSDSAAANAADPKSITTTLPRMSAAEAEQFLTKMEKEGRYKQETWS